MGCLVVASVDLGHMVLGRGQLVQQRAVVGHQKQTGGVLVEAPHGLPRRRKGKAGGCTPGQAPA